MKEGGEGAGQHISQSWDPLLHSTAPQQFSALLLHMAMAHRLRRAWALRH